MSEPRPRRAAVGAWVVYDVANTTFWTGVVGLAFPLWLVKELSGDDATLGYTLSATMVVVMLLAPILGAISDQTGRRMPLLVATTLVCVCATLLLGNGGLLVSLCLFALALGSMELGVILYNSLLAEVSTQHNRGMVSGLGTGIGYVGSFIAVGVALVFTQLFTEPSRYIFVFRAVAVLFLLFALPIFFLLKERAIDGLPSTGLGKVSRAFSQLVGDLRSLQRFPGLRQFLTARFFYGMGINTAVAFAVVYASQTVGLGDREIQMVLLGGISIAIPSGVLWGALVDRIGPRRVLSFSLLLWIGVLLFAIAIPELSLSTHLYWVVGCFHRSSDVRRLDGRPALYAQPHTAPIPWRVLWATRNGEQIRPGRRPLYVGLRIGNPGLGPDNGGPEPGRVPGGLVHSVGKGWCAGGIPLSRPSGVNGARRQPINSLSIVVQYNN